MIPKISCQQCNSELSPNDQFCGNCGAKVEWSHAPLPKASVEQQPTLSRSEKTCPLCGQLNTLDASSCVSCGGALEVPLSSSPQKVKERKNNTPQSQDHPLRFLQSWKLPATIAALLIIVLAIVRFTQKDNIPAGLPPNTQALSKEAESLQKAVEENPKNEQALLRLANLYHDTKMFARAIMMYDRYLEIHPSNPDARVDLGISYFEMGLIDTTNRAQYFTTAKDEIKKALTYSPQHQLAYYNLGMVNLHSGDMEEANNAFKKCATIDSNSEVGKRAQQLVQQHSFTNP